jgi:hypothetical protein
MNRRSFIENSAPDLYLLRLFTIICQNGGVLGGNGGGLFRNQYKLPCLHEIDIPKCINVYSIYRTKLGVNDFFVLLFLMFLDV